MLTKKVNFFQKCQEIRNANKKSLSSTYGSFAYARFLQIWKPYETTYLKNKENEEQYQKQRSEMIVFGCLSCFDEMERCLKPAEKKDKFQSLIQLGQSLAQEKTIMKVAIVNTLGQIRTMTAFHKQLLQN